MKRMGIRAKVFLLIFITFLLLFGTVLISPSFLFEQYYVFQKIKDVAKATDQFSNKQLKGVIDKETLHEATYKFSDDNDAYIRVFEKNGASIFDNNYVFTVETADKTVIEIQLTDLMVYANDFNALQIKEGSPVNIEGYIVGTNKVYPLVVNKKELEIDEQDEQLVIYKATHTTAYWTNITGTVKSFKMPLKTEGEAYKEKMVTIMNGRYLEEMLGSETIGKNMTVYKYTDVNTGITNYGILKVVDHYYMVVIISFQPNNNIGAYVAGYMRYIAIAGIFLVILLALTISKIISKPLIHINELATQMAALDFSKKIPIRSYDEIGLLSESLNKMSTELEKTLSDLNEANKKLMLDVEKSKQIEKMRKDFIADASHELKTPLGIIRAFTERIQDYFLKNLVNEEMIESTSIILDESKRMDKLIMDMNELSKLESKTITVNKQKWDFNELVESIIDKFEILIEEKEIHLHIDIQQEKTFIIADYDKIEQVMMNFISNAIRYTPEKGVISLIVEEDEGHKIKVSIENPCEEINRKDIAKLWDRFFRVDKSRSRKLGGTGIGLAIVKIILELHGFRYGVTKVDGGIKFWFATH